ncbi:MAG: hypothetical protein DYG99_10575 [Bacteroidetes bacterium CHB5]|nr:hypothetical protein [Bacteroidetes bacterium CHB5]
MKRHLFIMVFLLIAQLLWAQNNVRILEGLTMESKILGQEVKYSIILPENYHTTKERYPVVYLLHGLGDNESSWLEYGRASQIIDGATNRGDIIPMIYVMPQGFRNYYVNDYTGKFLYEDMFIKELVPFIDKHYRTIPDKKHRATLGYSMGGFGALVLPLRNPDVFTVSVPLSISVRTDQQYMTEDASGWDDQWGRLFGAVGTTGQDRITDYYKQHSPFHIFAQADLSKFKDLKLYIDNGDDEGTLCRSNEELHILLREKKFQHEFRVRNGGHEFSYWRDALPNGLRFISDSFNQKAYRGDSKELPEELSLAKGYISKIIQNEKYGILLPEEYSETLRHYPVIYFLGKFDPLTREAIAGTVQSGISSGWLPPVIVVFLKENETGLINSIIPLIEKDYRARSGFRFRALIGLELGGETALRNALMPETFTSCAVFNSAVDCGAIEKAIVENKKAMARTWLSITTTDRSANFRSNGCAHMLLRDMDIYHEYRVQEGNGGSAWFLSELKETLNFTQRKIHR